MGDPAYLSADVVAFRDTFRSFLAAEVVPHLPEWERARRVPREFWLAMGRSGFLCPWLAEADGGSAAPFGFSVVILEELGRTGFMGVQTGVSVHSDVVVPYLDQLLTGDLRLRWLPACASGQAITAIGMT